MLDLSELRSSNPSLRKRTTLSEDIADLPRSRVLLEKYYLGMPLSEREIAASIGISRTPLREAVRNLEREGLIEYSPSRCPRLADPTLGEIADYLCAQGQLQALGRELACANATDQELENIASLNDAMIKRYSKDEPLESFQRDMSVHAATVAAGRNEPLIQIHATYNARLWRARFISSQHRISCKRTFEEHREIVNALLERDAGRTAKALRHHLTTAVSNIA